MNIVLPHPSAGRRSSLLGIVVAAHLGALLLILAARTVAPRIAEIPMVVELLQPPAEQRRPEPKPLPVARPQPADRPRATPRAAVPVIEATASTAPSLSAPVTPAVAAKPEPPAEPAITHARFDADYLKNPAPPYPPLSRRMGEQGKVVLRVLVSAHGTAESVEVRTSSGSQRLDEAAANTVRHWKFVPARRGEAAVHSWVLVPINFKLEQ